MLKMLRMIGFRLGSREARCQVERRLRAESLSARRRPSADLYSRTLSALNDARLETPVVPDRSPGRYAVPRFALALLVVVAMGTLAVRLSLPETTGDIRLPQTPAILTGFDALRLRLQNIENTWEAPLRTEASLLAEDARSAGRYVLASLPLPASWRAD
jgi:hypothetical protein